MQVRLENWLEQTEEVSYGFLSAQDDESALSKWQSTMAGLLSHPLPWVAILLFRALGWKNTLWNYRCALHPWCRWNICGSQLALQAKINVDKSTKIAKENEALLCERRQNSVCLAAMWRQRRLSCGNRKKKQKEDEKIYVNYSHADIKVCINYIILESNQQRKEFLGQLSSWPSGD